MDAVALAVIFDEFDVSEREMTDFVVQFTLTLAVHVLLGHGDDVANLWILRRGSAIVFQVADSVRLNRCSELLSSSE